jgi:hypothetical protein
MNMAQRAARHQKMEGLLAYAAAYGEDAEAERLRSMFALRAETTPLVRPSP